MGMKSCMSKNISVLIFVWCIILMTSLLNKAYLQSNIVSLVVYLIESLLIAWLTFYIYIKDLYFFANYIIVLSSFIIVSNFLYSSTLSEPSLLLKIWGYLCTFGFGAIVAKEYKYIYINRNLLRFFIVAPLLLVLFLDKTPSKEMFFADGNMYTLYGVCCSMLYYVCNEKDENVFKKSIGIVIVYLAVGSSMGIIVAFLLSSILINKDRRGFIKGLLLLSIIFLAFVAFVDIPITYRIKNTFDIFSSLSIDDWKNLGDVNLYDLQMDNPVEDGNRSDNTSAIWRMKHWLVVVLDYISNIPVCLPFGEGVDYISTKFGKAPHNEWLRILAEFGVVIFAFCLIGAIKLYKRLKNSNVSYFVLPFIFYMLTENIVETYINCSIFFMVAGYSYYHVKMKSNSMCEKYIVEAE